MRVEAGITLAENHAPEKANNIFLDLINKFSALRHVLDTEVKLLKNDQDVREDLKKILEPLILDEEHTTEVIVQALQHFLKVKTDDERERWLVQINKALKELQDEHTKEQQLLAA